MTCGAGYSPRYPTSATGATARPAACARGRPMVLGLIISDITNPFFTAVVRGVEDVAQLAGYSVVLANADEDVAKESRYLEVAAAEQMAGVLLTPASSQLTSIDVLLERNIPVVTIDRRLANSPVDSVTVNNRQATLAAAEHLIGQGCQRVGFVAGPVAITHRREPAGRIPRGAARGRPPDDDGARRLRRLPDRGRLRRHPQAAPGGQPAGRAAHLQQPDDRRRACRPLPRRDFASLRTSPWWASTTPTGPRRCARPSPS